MGGGQGSCAPRWSTPPAFPQPRPGICGAPQRDPPVSKRRERMLFTWWTNRSSLGSSESSPEGAGVMKPKPCGRVTMVTPRTRVYEKDRGISQPMRRTIGAGRAPCGEGRGADQAVLLQSLSLGSPPPSPWSR